MAVVQPTTSKKSVMRAGKTLADCYENQCELEAEALDILNNWRLSHSYPLEKIRLHLEKHAKSVDSNRRSWTPNYFELI
ncbi:hypothetical protein [Psychromonas arctica]|uniref:hypothetical protein n=1 Tax=Psychromonas arctica TaxID=168275 RepID=UPI002FD5FC17